MNTIGYFEIQSSDPKREITFYEAVFEWGFTEVKNLPIEYYSIEGAGINGGLLKRPVKVPPMEYGTNAYCNSIEVADFEKTASVIMQNSGKVAMPKFAIEGKCWQGYFLDADNNVFGIFQVDPNAK